MPPPCASSCGIAWIGRNPLEAMATLFLTTEASNTIPHAVNAELVAAAGQADEVKHERSEWERHRPLSQHEAGRPAGRA
ncbi:hypothetical protein CBM2592_U20004 [Cupriavidus taiwanensis]|nr:hypothetical protein CBM2592_U20004 [Cupriavidus taiwanensis]